MTPKDIYLQNWNLKNFKWVIVRKVSERRKFFWSILPYLLSAGDCSLLLKHILYTCTFTETHSAYLYIKYIYGWQKVELEEKEGDSEFLEKEKNGAYHIPTVQHSFLW